MTVCRSSADLRRVVERWKEEEIDAAVVNATKAGAEAVMKHATTLRTTWAQPLDIWTGRFRYSWSASVDGEIPAPLPPLDDQGVWPDTPPKEPYTLDDMRAGAEVFEKLKPYQIVTISNAVPYAADVEANTGIVSTAVELAKRDIAGKSFAVDANEIPF